MKRVFLLVTLAMLLMTAALYLSAALALPTVELASKINTAWAANLVERPDRVFRRFMLFFGALTLFGLTRKLGWKGRLDCGWRLEGQGPHASLGHLLLKGVLLGALSIGLVRAVAIALGFHSLSELNEPISRTVWKIILFVGSGAAVGILEETVCRGIMFRALARNAGVATGAIISSAIFAIAHFISPDEQAFQLSGTWLARSISVAHASFTAISMTGSFWIRFLNLFLIGLAMCGLLARTGSVWMSVACHGAWVWIIRTCHYLTDYAPTAGWAWILGRMPDATDSPIVALLLAFLAAWGFAGAKAGYIGGVALATAGSIHLRVGRFCWRVSAEDRRQLEAWLKQHAPDGRPAAGKVLKEYPGCEVRLLDGVVFKRKQPHSLMCALRSWFVPCRARRAFANGHRLLDAGVNVARPLAWAAWREGVGRAEALLTLELSDTEPLNLLLPRVREDAALRKELVEKYAELAAAFHDAGFSNRDLKDENVLVSTARPFQLWAIDLDGARRRARLSRRRAARDLYRVGRSLQACGCLSEADVSCFFAVYNKVVPQFSRHTFP